jgi:hypothetical protein
MRNDYTHLVVLLDRSGSMAPCWKDTVGGINAFLEEQKLVPGHMTFSLYLFNTAVTKPLNFVDIRAIENANYFGFATGGTSLCDAYCMAVDETGQKLASMREADRPGKVLFVVVTDGGENASKVYNIANCKERLTRQRDNYSWNFMFMGADFDSATQAESLGSSAAASIQYTKGKTKEMFMNFSDSVGAYRCSSNAVYDVGELRAMQERVEKA